MNQVASSRRRVRTPLAIGLAVVLAGAVSGFTWPWEIGGPWPRSSTIPVTPLVSGRLELDPARRGVEAGFRFAVFGDQRALADGEWQVMLRAIDSLAAGDEKLLFMLDTGDIVNDGVHDDQFTFLREILKESRLPYLVAVGNHELDNNRTPKARSNTATFLRYLDPEFSHERMYYRKDIGALRLYCLDSNDLVYGEAGENDGAETPAAGTRTAAQLDWLAADLARGASDTAGFTVVAIHHPLVQSSTKHREAAASLWNLDWKERRMADILLDGGVDLVLVGHTHTYERFRLTRADGRSMALVNLSGRPRTGFLWFGRDQRRARDIRGRETKWLEENGWRGLAGWSIVQEDLMRDPEQNQFAIVDLGPGGVTMTVHFLDAETGSMAAGPPFRLK
jgi:hypothetical protein